MGAIYELSQQVISFLLEVEELGSDLDGCSIPREAEPNIIARINGLAEWSRTLQGRLGEFSVFHRAHLGLYGANDPLQGRFASYHDQAFYKADAFLGALLCHEIETEPGQEYVVPLQVKKIDAAKLARKVGQHGDHFPDASLLEVAMRREAAAVANLIGESTIESSSENSCASLAQEIPWPNDKVHNLHKAIVAANGTKSDSEIAREITSETASSFPRAKALLQSRRDAIKKAERKK